MGQTYLIMGSSILNYYQVNRYMFFVADLLSLESFILLCCVIELVVSVSCVCCSAFCRWLSRPPRLL